jgi:glutathione S-transferase
MKREPDIEQARTTWREKLPPKLDYLEAEVARAEFLVGAFSLADISVATQFINLEIAAGRPDAARWPALSAYLDRICGRPSFAGALELGRKLVPTPFDLG